MVPYDLTKNHFKSNNGDIYYGNDIYDAEITYVLHNYLVQDGTNYNPIIEHNLNTFIDNMKSIHGEIYLHDLLVDTLKLEDDEAVDVIDKKARLICLTDKNNNHLIETHYKSPTDKKHATKKTIHKKQSKKKTKRQIQK
jgi:hypothetical protein